MMSQSTPVLECSNMKCELFCSDSVCQNNSTEFSKHSPENELNSTGSALFPDPPIVKKLKPEDCDVIVKSYLSRMHRYVL